jgi:thiamine-phosphate pyrophosphorylase
MKKFGGLYVITDENLINSENYFDIIDSVLKHKPTFVQLRAKNLSKKDLLFKAMKIREISLKYDVKFIVNDYVDVAIESGADGVHIGLLDARFNEIREKIGDDKIVGVSCYGDIDRCVKFSQLGADYIAIGTPYSTKTKPGRKKTDLTVMTQIIKKITSTPIFAIGGIDKTNIREIQSVGVDGVAVINAVFNNDNPASEAQKLVSFFNKSI